MPRLSSVYLVTRDAQGLIGDNSYHLGTLYRVNESTQIAINSGEVESSLSFSQYSKANPLIKVVTDLPNKYRIE